MSNDRSRRRRTRRSPASQQPPCDQLGPDDGIDPRILFRNEHRRPDDGRKTLQLCAQAARALRFALTGACGDPILQQLDVRGVEPAPDARRLRVVVVPPSDAVHPDEVLERISLAQGLLRSAVAAAIRRRRAPELVFELRPEASS